MTTVILLRHGRTTANTGGVLAGWTPGVQLDETGAAQVRAVGERLAKVPLAAVVSSPLERCVQTAGVVAAGRDVDVQTDDRLGEARYGDWTGQTIKELVKEPLWKVVQQHPSAAVFPGPEGRGWRRPRLARWPPSGRGTRSSDPTPSGSPAATAT
ncbi:histidine phosphatase family protein [Blastococcus brunescens]|uniref:Histidine phosphatase family protein n=1 Tax=Blastococcus brunescens TaxID=1564165 RepID=A0ABZ1B9Q0_9ACTN|nr:histidine phosphatase family protein [Blastococcus sp. BMG 8361]WRL66466.1 histidine phosphatase family protein [Blastococcus sp. BMG 8361]